VPSTDRWWYSLLQSLVFCHLVNGVEPEHIAVLAEPCFGWQDSCVYVGHYALCVRIQIVSGGNEAHVYHWDRQGKLLARVRTSSRSVFSITGVAQGPAYLAAKSNSQVSNV